MNIKKIIFILLVCIMEFVAAISAEANDITFANIELDHLDIVELYISDSNSGNRGENIIKGSAIPNNEDIKFNIRNQLFDLCIIREYGTKNTFTNLNNIPQNKLLLLEKDNFQMRQPGLE